MSIFNVPLPSWYSDIHLLRIGGDALYSCFLSPKRPKDDFYLRAIIIGNRRDAFGLNILVTQCIHFKHNSCSRGVPGISELMLCGIYRRARVL